MAPIVLYATISVVHGTALLTRCQVGTIMLTHELNNFTMSEAIKFYDQLKAAFKYLVPMGVATNQTQPYVETNYSLPNFEQCWCSLFPTQ